MLKSSIFTFTMLGLSTTLLLSACQDGMPAAQTPQTASQAAIAASIPANKPYINEFAAHLPADAPSITAATTAKEPPFEFRDKDGHIIGFEVDLLTAAAANQGIKVQFMDKPWEDIFEGLEQKSYDVVMGTAGETAERREKYALSKPYYATPNVIVVPKDSPIKKLEDLNGKKVGVMSGGIAQDDLSKHQIKAEFVTVSTSYAQIVSLAKGQTDAAVMVGLSAAYYADSLDHYEIRLIPFKPDEEAQIYFVMNKNNPELLDKINKGLDNIKQNGVFDKIQQKWLKNVK